MKIRLFVAACILALATPLLFADNGASANSQTQASSQTKQGFGLQAAIFSEVRQSNTNLTTNISNLSEYTPTPGDEYTLTVVQTSVGTSATQTTTTFPVRLNEDMTLDIPFIGTINARGKSIPQLRREIVAKVSRAVPVQYVNFVLSRPAEFNVFVYGGVNSPGYVVANPLVTVIDAIALAKGFKAGASYRRIELFHNGTEKTLDISKYYTEADLSVNPRLQPGDKIYIPPAKIIASITGRVKYPGAYELLPSENLATLVDLAGGTTPGALTSRIEVSRTKTDGSHQLLTVPLKDAQDFKVQMGDTISVLATSQNSQVVTINGAVYGKSHSGDAPVQVPAAPVRVDFPYYQGMTLLSVLDSVGGPTPYAKRGESYILQHATGKKIPVKLNELWKTRDQSLDQPLQPGDQIVVPMQTLKVFVTGQVKSPGAEPYQPDLTVADYLLFAGGIDDRTADPKGLYLISLDGKRTQVSPHDTVPPGANLYVARKPLFQANQFFQNLFVTTGWITGIISAASIIYNFLILIHVL